MVNVRKVFGEYPVDTVVLAETVHFDENGKAEVSEEVASVLAVVPGYEVEEAETASEAEETEEPVEEEAPTPKKSAPKKPAPKK